MKSVFLGTLLALAASILLGACTSSDTTADVPIKTGGLVPGEKSADEVGAAAAGPGSAAAGVRW